MRARLSLLSLVLLAACSSGGDGEEQSLSATPTPTTAASTAPTAGPGATTKPDTAGAPSASAAATGGATSGGTGGGTAPAKPRATTAPGRPAAAKATAPGTYTYDATGTVTLGNPGTPQDVDGEQTLEVSPLKGDVQHSTLHTEQGGDTEQDLVVRDKGTYAASLKISTGADTREFLPDPPVLVMPDPATVGAAWKWAADSTDGKSHVTADNRLTKKETLTIGGKQVVAFVLTGDVQYTADLTTWWAPDYRLPVKTRSVGKGSYNGFAFATDITATMRSVTPA